MAKKPIEKEADIAIAAASMKAIAHPLRLKILCVLSGGALSVQDIVEQVGTTQSNISQHYRIGDARTLKLVGLMRDVFCSVQ